MVVLEGGGGSYERGTPVCTPTEGMVEQDLAGGEGGLLARWRAPCIHHIARPLKHRLGAIGAIELY